MVNNLKVNYKLLKNIRTKLCIGFAILGLSLTSCNFGWSQSKEDEFANTNAVNVDKIEYATLKINTKNRSNEQFDEEIICLGNKKDGIYAIFKLKDKETNEVGLICTDSKSIISSYILDETINLYDIQPDDIVTLNIDYLTGEMNYTIEKEKIR